MFRKSVDASDGQISKREIKYEYIAETDKEETIIAENKRLKEVLSRERRHHAREKNRIRQVLFAIDEALASLPSRLGKIRMQNQRNMLKMSGLPIDFGDRGDFEFIFGLEPSHLPELEDGDSKLCNVERRTSLQMSEDVCSDISTVTNNKLVRKMESLNHLIEGIKRGKSAPIEAVLNNELCAISLLKNEIKCTKRKIEQKSKTDSDSVIVTNWQSNKSQDCTAKVWCSGKTVGSDDIRRLENYIWLQKEAISVLSVEVQKTKDMFYKEMKEKEKAQSEKRDLMTEITLLRNPKEKLRSDSQRIDRFRSPNTESPANRPFRIIRELKSQLEEKDKLLATWKAKFSRLESAAANKGTLLDIEKRKCEDLEAKLKIATQENKSFSMQIQSLQFINAEMKEQMEVLKSQIDILINQNSEVPTGGPFDLKKHFAELTEILKNDEGKVRKTEEEAKKKMEEMENRYCKEIDLVKTSYERSEKINIEYLRTLKALLLSMHNYQLEKIVKMKSKDSCDRVKEILGITDAELENLFSGNVKETGEKELEDLYNRCCSIVSDDEECQFSIKLSAWLFDLIKQKMTSQNPVSYIGN